MTATGSKPAPTGRLSSSWLGVDLGKFRMAKGGEAVGPTVDDIFWNLLSLGTAVVIWNFGYPIEEAKVFRIGWMARVIFRNLLLMTAAFQGFHYAMYESSFRKSFSKFNPRMPKDEEIRRDRSYTILSLIINSVMECMMLHCWATGAIPYQERFLDAPGIVILMLCLSPFLREIHFVIYHRILHIQPLFKWFHAHHHLSYNPSPWSGLSMHPVESSTYFTGPIIPCLVVRTHPLVYLFANVHAQIASVYGHHGHEEYGGSYFHYLHHSKVWCNYGTPFLPLDILMGTWETGHVE